MATEKPQQGLVFKFSQPNKDAQEEKKEEPLQEKQPEKPELVVNNVKTQLKSEFG